MENQKNMVGLLDMFCWRNALDIIVLLCENKGKISIDDLCFKMILDKSDILERFDFLKKKGIPIEYDKETNCIEWQSEKLCVNCGERQGEFVCTKCKQDHAKEYEIRIEKLMKENEDLKEALLKCESIINEEEE